MDNPATDSLSENKEEEPKIQEKTNNCRYNRRCRNSHPIHLLPENCKDKGLMIKQLQQLQVILREKYAAPPTPPESEATSPVDSIIDSTKSFSIKDSDDVSSITKLISTLPTLENQEIKQCHTRLSPDCKNVSWFFFTSANLSKSSLGQYFYGYDAKIRTINNYEAGILFIPKFLTEENTFPIGDKNENGTPPFSLPYDVPLTPYETDDEPFVLTLLHHKTIQLNNLELS